MNINSILKQAKSWIVVPTHRNSSSTLKWEDRITDDWFRAHFNYAADVTSQWLSKAIDVPSSKILDFGCGDGIMDLGLALKQRPQQIIGLDIHDSFKYLLETAKSQIGIDTQPTNLRFITVAPGESLRALGSVDAVFSWSVFEHIQKTLLPGILSNIHDLLPRSGIFFLQIEPLYYSPFGSHLSGLITEPWAHLLLSHDQLMEEIDNKRVEQMSDHHKNKTFDVCSFDDFKAYLKREYNSLNRLTISELLKCVEDAGFVVEAKETHLMDLATPPELLAKHSREDLACNEIMLLLRRM